MPSIDEIFSEAATSAGLTTTGPATTERPATTAPAPEAATEGPAAPPTAPPGAGRLRRFRHRRPKLTVALVVLAVLAVYPSVTYAQALRKEGQESVQARTVQWGRDMKLGFLIDKLEQKKFAEDQYERGGNPDADAFAAAATTVPLSTKPGPTNPGPKVTTTTAATIPHLTPPARMASPISPALTGEGEWVPAGPLVGGLPAVYTTKVRSSQEFSSLTVFAAWVDPKLAAVKLFPGTDLPGGTWNAPHFIPPDQCGKAIMAANGGFRFEQPNTGYYAEGREPYKLKDGAASLVLYQDGHVDIAKWGRDVGRDQLPQIDGVRQNLQLLIDDGKPTPEVDKNVWGAQLPNSYFIWRSAYGVTKDGALVYIGGPALPVKDLVQHLLNAGAVRAMEGDINPEWVTPILYSTDATGKCVGKKGLSGTHDKGGQMGSENRYLSTDTRDFIAVFTR